MMVTGAHNSRELYPIIQSTIFHKKGATTVNTTNNQPKAAKKLTINKETIRQISSTTIMAEAFGTSLDCNFTFLCTLRACPNAL